MPALPRRPLLVALALGLLIGFIAGWGVASRKPLGMTIANQAGASDTAASKAREAALAYLKKYANDPSSIEVIE